MGLNMGRISMIRIIKLFWSFNIIKIEKWLREKALEGYILKDVNINTRVFTFNRGDKKDITYRICYGDKGIDHIENGLKRNGWYNLFSTGKWTFIANENKLEEIRVQPSRENLLKRIRVSKVILSCLLLYYVITRGMFSLLLISMIFSGSMEVYNSNNLRVEYGILDYGFIIIKLIFPIIVFIILFAILKNEEKQLKGCFYEGLDNKIFKEELESENKLELIKIFKLGWVYSPDKLEQWLQEMERKGLNLYKISKNGCKFYFFKGKPRKIKYVADLKKLPNEICYEIYKEDNWDLAFRSSSSIFQWTIWKKEYKGKKPEIYSDRDEGIKYARRVLLVNLLTIVPLMSTCVFMIIMETLWINSRIHNIYILLIFILIFFQQSYLFFKTLLCYSRLKRDIYKLL